MGKIEKQNLINANVFGYENGRFYPIRMSEEQYDDHMELLYIEKGENSHYCLNKRFNSLMYNFSKHKDTKHFCMRCVCISVYIVFLQKLF